MSCGLLSGDPSEIGEQLSEMCIKSEINDVESGSKAFYESMIYTNNDLRNLDLQDMEGIAEPGNDLIALSKQFLANMREAITQQNEFIEMFAIQPDFDEQHELKIASKGWYNMLRRQLMTHRSILANASNQAAGMHELRCKISKEFRCNCQIERRLGQDSIKRFQPPEK